MILRPLMLFVLLIFTGPAAAQDAPALPGQSAQDLVEACKAEGRHVRYAVERQWDVELFGQIDVVECTAYLAGIADMNAVARRIFGRGVFCFPRTGVTAEQQIAALLRWAQAHPHRLDESRRSAAVSAFVERWPCG